LLLLIPAYFPLDFFHGSVLENVNLAGLEHVIICSVVSDVIYFRVYRVLLRKSGSKLPRVELAEIGPRLDLQIRRYQFPNSETWSYATKQPKELQPTKQKNIKTSFQAKTGTVHLGRQDLNDLETRKIKGLNKKRSSDVADLPQQTHQVQKKKK
jgi:ribosome production factor 2